MELAPRGEEHMRKIFSFTLFFATIIAIAGCAADKATIFYTNGIAKYRQGNYNEAILDFTEAIILKPFWAEAFYYRGNAKANNGDYVDAIKDFSESIRLKADYIEAYNRRGSARMKIGDSLGANEDFNMARELEKENIRIHFRSQ